MSKKKVLVIGGTGIAGQFITDYLLHYHDICELFIASRGIHKISEKKVKFIKMDIHDTQNIESVIKQFDIIILALGPFSCVGTDIYTICLRNHVICVDILTSSLRTPKFFVKEFSYFLMPCHQHGLRINLLVQR